MFHLHCWHKIENSERKLKGNSKCQKSDIYVCDGRYVKYTIQEQCCVCGKVHESIIYRDYDIVRALKYKDRE